MTSQSNGNIIFSILFNSTFFIHHLKNFDHLTWAETIESEAHRAKYVRV